MINTCAVAILVFVLALPAVSAPAAAVVSIDPATQFQKWQGWGTSLAWWAKVVGGFPEPARGDCLRKAFDPVDGLGLNVVRYNIGGGENPQYLSPHAQFLNFRTNIPGYQSVPGHWDWSADANQRYVLREAIRLGADQLEAFSNSPPWWMTASGSVTGNHQGDDNLRADQDAAFADYLAGVAAHFHDAWGVTFRSVAPLNEPTNGWRFGGPFNQQEGCVVRRPHQSHLVKATADALARHGLRQTAASASDETSITAAIASFQSYSADTLNGIGKINTHSYGGGDRTRLSNLALSAGKDLWMSEYGDGDDSGLQMSRRIVEDINGLHPSAWVYWQVVDPYGGWGFLKNPLTDEANTLCTINKKYYVMAQYSKFIRPGCRFLAVDDPNTAASLNAKSGTLVIVATNSGGNSFPVTYDLSRFTRLGAAVKGYRTSPSENLSPLPVLALRGSRFSVTCPPRSVTTYVIAGAACAIPPQYDPCLYYTIISLDTGRALEQAGSGGDAGGSVGTGEPAAGDLGQQWRLIGQGSGTFKIVNRRSGLLLSAGAAGTILSPDTFEPVALSGQTWRIAPLRGGACLLTNSRTGIAFSREWRIVGVK